MLFAFRNTNKSVFLPSTSVWKLLFNKPDAVGFSPVAQLASKRALNAHIENLFILNYF